MLKINSAQNKQITFRAKLTPKTKNLLDSRELNIETKNLIKVIENDEQTKDVTLDIIRRKRNEKEFFSFNLIPDATKVKFKPHHPIDVMKPKVKRFFWKNLDEMLKNNILEPANIQKIKKTSIVSIENMKKYFQLESFDAPDFGPTLNKWLKSALSLNKMTEVKRK